MSHNKNLILNEIIIGELHLTDKNSIIKTDEKNSNG